LIAVGRKILNNPGWPVDTGLKSGAEGPFRRVLPQFGGSAPVRTVDSGPQPSIWRVALAGRLVDLNEVSLEETRKLM